MANPSNFEITRYNGPPHVENAKINFRNLYLHQIYAGPNPNQEQIIGGNPTSQFGKTAVNNWPIYDGVGQDAKLVARAQGMHMNASSWYTSFVVVFEVERFKGSTLQIVGATIDKDSEWAIVGGTGEFAMARGVIKRKVHKPIQDGEIQELTIDGVCRMKPILSKLGPWGQQGPNTHDIQDKPERLQSVTINHGDLIDSISFSYIDQAGQTQASGRFGRGKGNESKINLGPDEFVKEVTGTTNASHLTSLKLVSNIKTYGPFGKGGGTSFSTPAPQNGHVVGFYGTSDAGAGYMTSIGVYVKV